MTFENFTRLTQATLLNEPFLSSFYEIVFDPHKVKRGDLFVGNDKEAVKIALSRGAYAILSDRKLPVLDEEIAWLRTDSIDQSLISLLRYHIMEHELRFCYLDKISIALLQKIAPRERFVFLGNDLQSDFQQIMQASAEKIFISSDDRLLARIRPGYQECCSTEGPEIMPVKSTLFLSSFYVDNAYYENLKIPALFLPRLQNLLAFLQQEQITYDLHKCEFTPYFYPLFVNKALQVKPFGATPAVLIAARSQSALPEILDYITTHAPWAKTCCFLPVSSTIRVQTEVYHYKTLTELNRLKEIEFNFAIINDDLQQIVQSLKNLETDEQRSLF